MNAANPPASPNRPFPLWRLSPVMVMLAVIYTYSNALNGPFIFDDRLVVSLNPGIRTLWPIWVSMFPTVSTAGTAGRPLLGLSFAINYAIEGLNTRGYHAVNIALHVAVALILLGIARQLLKRWRHPHAEALALAITLVWAVHPLLTDSVTYISQRSEGLMAVFFLLTVYTFARSLDSAHARRWLGLSVLSAMAAAASKENAAMIPLVMLLFDGLLVTKSWRDTFKQRWTYYLLLLIPPVMLVIELKTISLQQGVLSHSDTTSWQYLLMQSQVITRYLQLSVWPTPLVITYSDWPVPRSLVDVWPWMVLIGGLFMATVYGVVRKRPWAMAGAWFFLILAPTSSFLVLQTEPGGERRMYLPLIAVVALIILSLERWTRSLPARAWVTGLLLCGLIITLSQATLLRNDDFNSAGAIWSDTVMKRPNNAIGRYELGVDFAQNGYTQNALDQFSLAMKFDPHFENPRAPHATMLAMLGQSRQAEDELLHWLATKPKDPELLTALGSVKYQLGDPQAAQAIWRSVLKADPTYAEAQRLLDESQKQSSPPAAVP